MKKAFKEISQIVQIWGSRAKRWLRVMAACLKRTMEKQRKENNKTKTKQRSPPQNETRLPSRKIIKPHWKLGLNNHQEEMNNNIVASLKALRQF